MRGTRTTSLVTNTMSPRWRSTIGGPEAAHEAVGAEQVHLHLAGEVVRGRRSSAVAGSTSPALDTTISIGPELRSSAAAAKASMEASSVRSSGSADGLAAVGDDLGRRLLEPVEPAGPEHHGVPGRGQRQRGGQADAGGGAGDHGGAALGVRREAGASAQGCTVVGRAAKPRTLTEWTRRMPAGSMS